MAEVLTLKHSDTGRIFCVGEIAGHFRGLQRFLTTVEFRPSRDRLILLGNFLGYTAQSRHAAHWLAKPWVTAVLGPHEIAVMSKLEGRAVRSLIGQWLVSMPLSERNALSAHLAALPVAFDIEVAGQACVASHFLIPNGRSWASIREDLVESVDISQRLAPFGSRLEVARSIGLLGDMVSWRVPDIDLNVSSVAIETPPKVFAKSGNRIVLFSSARVNHGPAFDRPSLLPFVELHSLIESKFRSPLCQGLVETLQKS